MTRKLARESPQTIDRQSQESDDTVRNMHAHGSLLHSIEAFIESLVAASRATDASGPALQPPA